MNCTFSQNMAVIDTLLKISKHFVKAKALSMQNRQVAVELSGNRDKKRQTSETSPSVPWSDTIHASNAGFNERANNVRANKQVQVRRSANRVEETLTESITKRIQSRKNKTQCKQAQQHLRNTLAGR